MGVLCWDDVDKGQRHPWTPVDILAALGRRLAVSLVCTLARRGED